MKDDKKTHTLTINLTDQQLRWLDAVAMFNERSREAEILEAIDLHSVVFDETSLRFIRDSADRSMYDALLKLMKADEYDADKLEKLMVMVRNRFDVMIAQWEADMGEFFSSWEGTVLAPKTTKPSDLN